MTVETRRKCEYQGRVSDVQSWLNGFRKL